MFHFLTILFVFCASVLAQLPAPAATPASASGVSTIMDCGTTAIGGTTLVQCQHTCFGGCVTCQTQLYADVCYMYTDPSLSGQWTTTSTTVVGPCRNPRIGAGLYIGTLFYLENLTTGSVVRPVGTALPPVYLVAPASFASAFLGPTIGMPEADLLMVDIVQGVIVPASWYVAWNDFGTMRDSFGVFWQLPNLASAIGTQWDVQSARLDATTLLVYLSDSTTFEVMP